MIPGIVGQRIRNGSNNLLLLNAFLLLVVVVVAVECTGYYREFFGGPYPATVDDLAAASNRDQLPHTFVSVPIDPQSLLNNYYHITGGQENANDYFFFADTPHGTVILRTTSDQPPTQISGEVETVSFSGDVMQRLQSALSGLGVNSTRPLMLHANVFRSRGYIGFAIGIPAAVFFAWNVYRAVKRLRNPLTHPAAKALALIGPPDEIAVAVDAEYRAGHQQTGKMISTQSWLLGKKAFGMDLMFLGDVVWAYKHELKQKTYGITVSKVYSTIVHDRHGRKLQFRMKEKQVTAILGNILRSVPWVLVGYDARLADLWKKQRPQFLKVIDDRKYQYEHAQAAAAAPPPPPGTSAAPGADIPAGPA